MSAEKRNKRKAQLAIALENRTRVMELRKAGATYQQISDKLDMPISTVGSHAKKAIAAWQKSAESDAGEIVALEVARLDALLLSMWRKAKEGAYQAVDRVLKIMERRAKLLGLDAPTKVAPTNPDGDEQYTGMSADERDSAITAIIDAARTRQNRKAELAEAERAVNGGD